MYVICPQVSMPRLVNKRALEDVTLAFTHLSPRSRCALGALSVRSVFHWPQSEENNTDTRSTHVEHIRSLPFHYLDILRENRPLIHMASMIYRSIDHVAGCELYNLYDVARVSWAECFTIHSTQSALHKNIYYRQV